MRMRTLATRYTCVTRHAWFAAAGVALLLAGCLGGSNTRHFQLDMTAANEPPAAFNLIVDRLVAADPLVQSEIMVQASPTEVRYYSDALWAASMSELMREKLSVEFGPLEPDRPSLLVTGRIRNCGRLEDGGAAYAHVRLDLALRLEGMGRYAEPLHRKTYETRRPLANDAPDDLVIELSRGIEDIAGQIIEDAMRLPLEPDSQSGGA